MCPSPRDILKFLPLTQTDPLPLVKLLRSWTHLYTSPTKPASFVIVKSDYFLLGVCPRISEDRLRPAVGQIWSRRPSATGGVAGLRRGLRDRGGAEDGVRMGCKMPRLFLDRPKEVHASIWRAALYCMQSFAVQTKGVTSHIISAESKIHAVEVPLIPDGSDLPA